MQSKESILRDLSDKILKIDANLPHNKIVKQLDKIAQQAYADLYDLQYTKLNQKIESDKNGHCC